MYTANPSAIVDRKIPIKLLSCESKNNRKSNLIHLSRASHYATTNASNKDSRPENTEDNRSQFHFTMKILILVNIQNESNLIGLIDRRV